MELLAIGSYLVGVLLLAFTFFPFSPMTLKFWMPKRETMLFAHQHRMLLRGFGSLGVATTFSLAIRGYVATEWGWVAGLTGVFFLAFWWGGMFLSSWALRGVSNCSALNKPIQF